MSLNEIISIVTLVINLLALIGIIAAIGQVRAAREALKAQSLLKLIDEWRNPDLYKSIGYIHKLRREWKEKPVEEWDQLAEKWVQSHVNKDINSEDPNEEKLAEEWLMRRDASQMIAKMSLLVYRKYLNEDDLFGVDPEIGRQMVVIIPIDIAIQRHFMNSEKYSISSWDIPAPKWEFRFLWPRYLRWYKKKGHKLFSLENIDWQDIDNR